MTEKKLQQIGFTKDQRGEYVYEDGDLRIVARESFGWEISIILPNGYSLSADFDRLHISDRKL